ncbi:hypothetical protein GCM10009799_27750 [Nocardiopsis rhodophaea]|uniref:HPr kinase/phosphorylase C-terminal domain-containing protein n=1 Tax=Nocardiopsis rhodophaea TaxID=280238 RepID=A0ABN2T582_9ACTN
MSENGIRETRIGFHGSVIILRHRGESVVERTLEFLGSHYLIRQVGRGDGGVLARVEVADTESAAHRAPAGPGRPIFIRKSASQFFTVPAEYRSDTRVEHLMCTRTGTTIAFSKEDPEITVALGADSDGLELIELLRDLVLKHQENLGSTVLHATSVCRGGGAVLVVGRKGAGKSTVAMELADALDGRVLSGDKALLAEEHGRVHNGPWGHWPGFRPSR